MAQSTNEIKQRIKGISSTMQITNAMELVSTAKMRKSREQLEKSRPYYTTVLSSIRNILAEANISNHPLLNKREVKKSLYIVVTGDRGLAGGYNSNVTRLVHSKFKDKKDSVCVITIGQKGKEFFERRGYEVVGSFTGISEEPNFSHAKRIGELATNLYKDNKIDEINIAYTRFISTLNYQPVEMKLLPAEIEEDKTDKNVNRVIEFEPSPERALDYLIPKYVDSSIFGALTEASASEQASRRTAMKSATENAEEMIEELNMTYNRARQAAITMEISEIVSGADALN